jgi:hypothetical protein
MRTLAKPQHAAGDVLTECIENMEDQTLKTSLEALATYISEAEARYESAASGGLLYAVPQELALEHGVTAADMVRVYSNRFARKRSPGRRFYDAIMAEAPHGRCPLCALRTVSSLDHYLPKTLFAAFVLAPINLIPACSDCNRLKLDNAPVQPTDQPLHPYFDNVENERWLYATVHESAPAALTFHVQRPAGWTDITFGRVQTHFTKFELGMLYTSHAAEELLNIRQRLGVLLGLVGPSGVNAHLSEQAASRVAHNINSWQTATYEALAQSAWYCMGGFDA